MEIKNEYGRRRGRRPGIRPGPVEPEEPDGEPIVEPRPVQCPKCLSEATLIYRTMPIKPKIRYRMCKDCGQRFKTVQK